MNAVVAVVVVAATFVGAARADPRGPRLLTWTIHSRYVDVAKAQFNRPPPGDTPESAGLRVDVLLPPGYDGVRRFPVLYLLHGHGDSYRSWINPADGDLLDIARRFPAIVVMPEAATGWYTNWWDGGARGSDGRAWESYFLDEVIPTAEQRLAILPGRANRAIAGLSMGGEGAIYLAEQLPGYFGSAATFSGTVSIQRPEWPSGFNTQGQPYQSVYGDPTAQQFYWTGHNPTALAANLHDTRMFVRVGDGLPLPVVAHEATNAGGAIAELELSFHAQDLVASARRAGVDTTYQPTTGVHDWPWWRSALSAALRWGFFSPVAERPLNWTYETVSTSGRAWDLSFAFSGPPNSVEKFTRRGDDLSATGTGTVTIRPDGGRPFTAALPFERRLA